MNASLQWLTVAAACVLAGCSTAPLAPAKSAVTAPARFAQAEASASEPVAEFWRGFADTQLDTLIGQAVAANTDLRVAAARVAEARALAEGSQGLGKPTLDVGSGVSRTRAPDSNGRASTFNTYSAGLETRWEIDLFGRIANEQSAAASALRASEAALRAAQVSVAAEVSRVYFELRGLQEQLRVTRLDLDAQRKTLELIRLRLSAGRGTALDVERATALVEGTSASVPALEAALIRAGLRLAVLTGQAPGALDTALAEQKPLPALPATPLAAIGSPERLLARRPDVAAAEAALRAAEALSGSARSRLYPSLTLQGSLGLNASSIGDFGNSASFVYNLGASLLWSIVDHGQRKAQVSAADARRDAALAQFDQTLLLALEETEGALAGFSRAQQRSDALMRAAVAADKAAKLAQARFEAGSSDYLVLLDAVREALQARDRLVQAQTASATSLVAVYRSLAGGWNSH